MSYEYDARGHSETDVSNGVIKLKVVGKVRSAEDESEYSIQLIRPVKVEGLGLCRGIMEPDWYDVESYVEEMREDVIDKIIKLFPSATSSPYPHLNERKDR